MRPVIVILLLTIFLWDCTPSPESQQLASRLRLSPASSQPHSLPASDLTPTISVETDPSHRKATLEDVETLITTPETIQIKKWGSAKIGVKVRLQDGRTASVRATRTQYKSDNPSIASVQGNGLVVGENTGNTQITVTVGTASQVIPVSVLALSENKSGSEARTIGVHEIKVITPEIVAGLGESRQLEAFAILSDGSKNSELDWVSSEPLIVEVDVAGQIKRLASGPVTITVLSLLDARQQGIIEVLDKAGEARVDIGDLVLESSFDRLLPSKTVENETAIPTPTPAPKPAEISTQGAPEDLSLSNLTETGCTLSWKAAKGASGYHIYRDGVRVILNHAQTSYAFTGLPSGNTYHFQVSAIYPAGESPKSEEVSFSLLASPSTISELVAPQSVSVSGIMPDRITLTWNAVPGALSYKVFKDEQAIAADLTTTSYTFTGLTPQTTVSLQVSAVHPNGESSKTLPLKVTTPGLTLGTSPTGLNTNNVQANSFTLNWNTVAGALSYRIYLNGEGLFESTTGNIKVTGIKGGPTYSVEVTAVNSFGESPKSESLSVMTIPDPPVNLASNQITNNSFNLSWQPVSGATSYNIFKDGLSIASNVTNPSYTVTGLIPSTTYAMQVSAVNAAGEGSSSSVLSVSTMVLGSKIALLNPDKYRILKFGHIERGTGAGDIDPDLLDNVLYSWAFATVADGWNQPTKWSGIGAQPDFITNTLTTSGYTVDTFTNNSLPALNPTTYGVLIVQDPLITNLKTFSYNSVVIQNMMPDLLEHFSNQATITNILNYINTGGKVILIGDAVRLLENGTTPGQYFLNFGKTVQVKNVTNTANTNGGISDKWLFIHGQPFCCRTTSASGAYFGTSIDFNLNNAKLMDINLVNRADLPGQQYSDTVYYPSDAVSLVDVSVSGNGNYDLSGAVCNSTVYNYTVNDTITKFAGYTIHNNKKIFYIGSDSYWDYSNISNQGDWHCGTNTLTMDVVLTSAGKNLIAQMVQYARNN